VIALRCPTSSRAIFEENDMKKTSMLSLFVSTALLSTAVCASPSDIVPTKLRAATKAATLPGMTLSRDVVHFSWNLDGASVAAPTPHVAESREYFVEADAATLRSGVALTTTAKGSVIKLTPTAAGGALMKSLTVDDISVRVNGEPTTLRDFAARVDDSRKLAADGVLFAPGAFAFVVDDSRGATSFELTMKSADRGYLVHVFEPASANVLTLTTNRDVYLVGEPLEVTARTANGAAIAELSGGIAAANGEITPIAFTRVGQDRFVGAAPLTAASAGALAEAFVVAKLNDGKVIALRDAKVGFAVADPVARIETVRERANGHRYAFSLDVAAEGRYQVEAVLYGAKAGERVPIAIAHTAAWLAPGTQLVTLRFDDLDLAKRGIDGPFSLGHIALKNQGALQTLERRAAWVVRPGLERDLD
jgi:hypothetical protein